MNGSLILIFFGTFFCADAIASMIYYGGYLRIEDSYDRANRRFVDHIPQVGRVIRVIFGLVIIAMGLSSMLFENIPIYIIICLFCIVSIICGYFVGKSF
jgi:hypothetical protein